MSDKIQPLEELEAFAVAHELCAGRRTLTESPDGEHCTATCEGCRASVTVVLVEPTTENQMVPLLCGVTGKTFDEIAALSPDEFDALIADALSGSAELRAACERIYRKASARAPKH